MYVTIADISDIGIFFFQILVSASAQKFHISLALVLMPLDGFLL